MSAKAKAKTKEDKYYYDPVKGDRVIKFIEKFTTHLKGELSGKPLILEDWQKDDILRPAFGTLRKSDGLRRYVTVYVEIARKNGKSALASALGIYLATGDLEPGAEVIAAAANKEQASIVFDTAKAMVKASKRLTASCQVNKDVIFHKKSQSVFKVISSIADTKHGLHAHGVTFDELHVQPNRKLYDVLFTSISARKQPLFFIITTAGLKNTFGEAIHDYALQVKSGKIVDETFLPIVYAAEEKDDPFDIKTWRKANPGLGSIKKVAYMEMMATRAKNSPTFLNTFKQLDLNIWTGAAVSWLGAGEWEACNFGIKKLTEMKDRECWGGLDLAYVRDLMSFALYFPPIKKEPGVLFVWSWCPEETIEKREQQENINYSTWVRDGYVFAIPGNANDTTFVSKFILELPENINLQSIAYDRWRANEMVNNLIDEGIDMQPYGQGYISMSVPCEHLETLVISKNINHQGNPVLSWQTDNVVMLKDAAGNIKPSKQKSKDKIDGLVASVMAIGQHLIESAEPDQESDYDKGKDMIFL